MAITAALVKELRDKSGAGMMDCKKALSETDGNIETAMDWLRTKGLAAAAKKSGRVAAEGLVAAQVDGNKGAVLEVNSETDFVARNEKFQKFVGDLVSLVPTIGDDMSALAAASYPGSDKTVQEVLTANIATIGEHMNLRRAATLEVDEGIVANYVHGAVAPGMGKIAALVALKSNASADILAPLGKQLAMHVAAVKPVALDVESLDPELIEREKQVQIEKAKESGKPMNIIERMIVGRMRKYYQEVVLLEQTFVIDGETTINKVLAAASKEAGTAIEISGYLLLELGAGIEKKEDDFAAEVAAMTNA